jgi:hypothetical protein
VKGEGEEFRQGTQPRAFSNNLRSHTYSSTPIVDHQVAIHNEGIEKAGRKFLIRKW